MNINNDRLLEAAEWHNEQKFRELAMEREWLKRSDHYQTKDLYEDDAVECATNAEHHALAATALRLQADQNSAASAREIDRLAEFILREVPGEPSCGGSAVDVAIRLIRLQAEGGKGDVSFHAAAFVMSGDLYSLLTDIANGIDSPATCGTASKLLVWLDKARDEVNATTETKP